MTPSARDPWPILAYADRLSLVPGESIRAMVSCATDSFTAQLVRLGRAGHPGSEEALASPIDGAHPGRLQPVRVGSYVHTAPIGSVIAGSYTVQAWVYPTLITGSAQTVIAQRCSSGTDFVLEVDGEGRLRLRQRQGGGPAITVASEARLAVHAWSYIAAVVDYARTRARVIVASAGPWSAQRLFGVETGAVAPPRAARDEDGRVYIAARQSATLDVVAHFNGKIEAPRIFRAALTDGQLEALMGGADPGAVAPGSMAVALEMGAATDSLTAEDVSGSGADGTCVNMPTRAVTGHAWAGQARSPESAPHLYGAIHFHEDDLDDAGWAADLELPTPHDAASGVYAFKLRAGEEHAYVPFYVRRPAGSPTSRALLMVPTNTYLAYANNRMAATLPETLSSSAAERPLRAVDRFVAGSRCLGGSLYDTHRDGSGICYASRLRPIPSMDPRYIDPQTDGPRHFAADLHLVAWLAEHGHEVDFATDEDLHREGDALLDPYEVLLTGSHPEYASGEMLDSVTRGLERGASLMYLGGNGFYWVTSFHRQRPHVIEVRRGFSGTRNWQVAPGEEHHSTTGEQGGLWRHRGRASHRLTGVGTTGHGVDPARAYRRTADSERGEVAFVFEGVEGDRFGDSGHALGGAAGDEVDASDTSLGTPPQAVVLAVSEPLVGYVPMLEDELWYRSGRTGENNPRIRSELLYFETFRGGAVFSVGSVSWCAALAADGHDNDVSTITGNVFRAFTSPTSDLGDD